MFKVALVANDDHPIPDWVSERFAAEGIDYVYKQCYNREDLESVASDADVVWFMSSRRGLAVEENMDIFKNAGCIIKCGSGTDNIDHEACTRRGIIVAHTPDTATDATSDHYIAMLLTAVRQTARQDHLIHLGIWDAKAALPVGPLTGAELGIIGLGRIGRAIIQKLSGFRMNIRVYDPYISASDIESMGLKNVGLEELLRTSQYVLAACPLTEETKELIGEEQLRMMRGDAIIVNVARAGIVDEKALIRALKESWIRAAALDVIETHPPGEEFTSLENLVMTPHMGGYPHDYPKCMWPPLVEEIIQMSKTRRPTWIVNKDVAPRWRMTSGE